VRPSRRTLTASTSFDTVVTHALTIAKHGDAEPRLATAGARFQVEGPNVSESVVAGPDGRTPPLAAAPGAYTVTEVEPPPGYVAAGPWSVEVADADVTLDVTNLARRGTLRIEKVDAVTGSPVDGATFAITDDSGTEVHDLAAPLLPGRYSIREVQPPVNYRRAAAPFVAEVVAGQETVVRVPNQPLASVGFEKRPPVPGATFTVAPASDQNASLVSCVTDEAGRCSLPPASLDAGRRYCWQETIAPRGWAAAPGQCLDLEGAGAMTTIVVDEPPLVAPAPAAQPTGPPSGPPPPSPPAPPTTAPEPPPDRSAAPVPLGPGELPVTGAAGSRRLASAGLGLVGVGLLLVSRQPAGSSLSDRRGRRGPRPPPTSATA
jgi:hypothetical protein